MPYIEHVLYTSKFLSLSLSQIGKANWPITIFRDLASRNCVISSDFIVKVSYPALCKDKYSREYFKHRNLLLPIRWLAPECIQEDEYTTKSDIFAYGVFVWELFTQATKLPFEELSNEEFLKRSQAGTLDWECAEATPTCLKDILVSIYFYIE